MSIVYKIYKFNDNFVAKIHKKMLKTYFNFEHVNNNGQFKKLILTVIYKRVCIVSNLVINA